MRTIIRIFTCVSLPTGFLTMLENDKRLGLTCESQQSHPPSKMILKDLLTRKSIAIFLLIQVLTVVLVVFLMKRTVFPGGNTQEGDLQATTPSVPDADTIMKVKTDVWGKPLFKPKRVTYLTQGDQPTWEIKNPGEIVNLPVPQDDVHLSFYTAEAVNYFYSTLLFLNKTLNPRYISRSLPSLMKIRKLFPQNTQKVLMEWANLNKGSPWNGRAVHDSIYQMKVLATKPNPSGQQLSCDNCFIYDSETILAPRNPCQGSDTIDIFAVITTVPKAFKERMAIRETWGTWSRNNTSNFRYVFLIGGGWPEKIYRELETEHLMFNDILQDNYIDTYYNLSYKVISGYKWLVKTCPHVKFVMRSADDNFVNIPHMIDLVREYGHEETFQDYQVGTCYVNYRPYRWPDFKGYVSTEEYKYDIFPPYALGTTFLTSMKLTKEILEHFPNVPFMTIEDSYFGILLWRMKRGCHDIEIFNENSVQYAKPPYYSQHPLFAHEIQNFFKLLPSAPLGKTSPQQNS